MGGRGGGVGGWEAGGGGGWVGGWEAGAGGGGEGGGNSCLKKLSREAPQ